MWEDLHRADPGAVMELRAGAHRDPVWHVPQLSPLGRCVADLPLAIAPLWQLEQLPITCAWSTRVAGRHVLVT